MMRGILVAVTAALSIVYLKRQQFSHHYIGIFLVISGVFIVGTTSHNVESSTNEQNNDALGLIILFIG